jgi:two-component system cell cycle response regulator
MNTKEKIDILIVDDREENLLTLESILENPELNIVKALSGNEALGLMSEYDFALVLLDIQMPEMDGFETAKLIKRNQKTRNVPIIFVTAINKQRQHIFKGYEIGAIDYIYKPFDMEILQYKIKAHIELFKQKRSLKNTTKKLEKSIHKLIQSKLCAEEISLAQSFFLANMGNEISLPLNEIIDMTDLVLLENNLPKQHLKKLKSIKHSGKNLLNIINDILDIIKIETKYMDLEHTEFNIKDILQKVIHLLLFSSGHPIESIQSGQSIKQSKNCLQKIWVQSKW